MPKRKVPVVARLAPLRWTNKPPVAQNDFVKTPRLFLCALIIGGSAAIAAAQTPTPDPALYGPYPANYKEVVMKWLQTQLIDPGSARIEWKGDPQPADLGRKGEHLYGYLVNFTVNARNRFGAYTGKQGHGALIRNGEVIKGIGLGY
jgi:hypothetical protein